MRRITLKSILVLAFRIISVSNTSAQNQENPFRNGAEINILVPIYPGNEFAAQYTRVLWRKNQLNAFSRIKNHVTTGKDYDSFAILSSVTSGYKYSFGTSKRYYSILQVGVAKVVYKVNP